MGKGEEETHLGESSIFHHLGPADIEITIETSGAETWGCQCLLVEKMRTSARQKKNWSERQEENQKKVFCRAQARNMSPEREEGQLPHCFGSTEPRS